MQSFKYIVLGILIFGGVHFVHAQEKSQNADRVIETILEDTETEEQDNQIVQELYYYAEHPMNINEATEDELQRLYLLNPFQINNLKDYINSRGNILSKYEMQLIYGFDRDVIRKIAPFITFGSASESHDRDFSFSDYLNYSNNQLLLRSERVLEQAKGYKDLTDDGSKNPKYLGSPYKYYLQYKNRYSDFVRWGITMEKDQGEEFFSGSNRYGFDYYSGYLSIRNTRFFDALVLGDYHVRFGQGLSVWSGFSFGKTPYVLDIMKTRTGFDEYSSTNENQFFRGAAVSKSIKRFKISAFYSNKAIDANIVEGVDGRRFTSFQNTGYHRTQNAVENKDKIREQVMGGDVTYNMDRFKVGFSGVYYNYNGKRITDSTGQDLYDFRGSSAKNLGLHFQFQWQDFYFFGEESAAPGHGYAFLNGVRGDIAKGISLSLLHRYFQPEYIALYSGGFSENSSNQNEEGWYLGVKTELIPDLAASMYIDVFRFPWLRFITDAPSTGYEYLADIDYSLGDKGRLSARFKRGLKGENFTNNDPFVSRIYDENKSSYRLHFNYKISERVLLRNRVAMSRYKQKDIDEHGWMLYQDLQYSFDGFPLELDFRYAIFNTDSYKTRIYAYEHDLLYAFSIPAYYSKGFRTYLTAHYNKKNFDVWFKISRFFFADKQEIGSGNQLIQGNQKTNVKLQMMFKW
jgi:hypothetical protein